MHLVTLFLKSSVSVSTAYVYFQAASISAGRSKENVWKFKWLPQEKHNRGAKLQSRLMIWNKIKAISENKAKRQEYMQTELNGCEKQVHKTQWCSSRSTRKPTESNPRNGRAQSQRKQVRFRWNAATVRKLIREETHPGSQPQAVHQPQG